MQIAGVALNGILHRGDIEKAQDKLKTVSDTKFRKIFGLLYHVNKKIDLFTKYNVDKIFEFRIVSVDNKFRGAGIAKQLMLRSEIIAEEYGFKVRIITKKGKIEVRQLFYNGCQVILNVLQSFPWKSTLVSSIKTECYYDFVFLTLSLLNIIVAFYFCFIPQF